MEQEQEHRKYMQEIRQAVEGKSGNQQGEGAKVPRAALDLASEHGQRAAALQQAREALEKEKTVRILSFLVYLALKS